MNTPAKTHPSLTFVLSAAGARFVLLFPQVEEETPAAPLSRETKAVTHPTVLLVEDDHAIRILLHNSLEKRGYYVIEARDGAEALLQSELYEETIHLLITDVVMPREGGHSLAARLVQVGFAETVG